MHKKTSSGREQVGNDPLETLRVAVILAALDGRVVVDLDDTRVPVIVLDIHTIEPVADGIGSIDAELPDMGRDLVLRHALYAAVHNVAIDRGLDLEGNRRDRVLAGIQEFPVEDADP